MKQKKLNRIILKSVSLPADDSQERSFVIHNNSHDVVCVKENECDNIFIREGEKYETKET